LPNDALTAPAIDYTNKDYASLRQAMLDLAGQRLPEWTDRSEAEPAVVLIELFAMVGDILSYYLDRSASEAFPHTATERRSILQLLQLIGYRLAPPVAAQGELFLTFADVPQGQPSTVTIPAGAQFATKPANGTPALTFEYQGPDLVVDLSASKTFGPLPVEHSTSIRQEDLGRSTSEANQRFPLSQKPVIPESVEVFVDEGAGPVRWDRRENLLYYLGDDGRVTLAKPKTTDYTIEFDENWTAFVVFGDGVYGRPPNNGAKMTANYRIGGGAVGNVAAGAAWTAKTAIKLLQQVANVNPASGGVDGEPIEHAVRFGPLAYRSGFRAVTLNDYVALAQQAGGVAKVRAVSRGWNSIDLYVVPQGTTVTVAPPKLKEKLVKYFEDKRMVGTFIYIKDPVALPVRIDLTIYVDHNYNADFVKAAVQNALQDLYSFDNMDFAKILYISKVYEAVEAVPGVSAANVTRFQVDRPTKLLLPAQPPDGRIVAGEFEVPMLATLNLTVGTGPV